VKNFSSCKFTT